MVHAMADDYTTETLNVFLGYLVPQFSGQCDVADVNVTPGLAQHLLNKRFVHHGLAAVGVQMTCS